LRKAILENMLKIHLRDNVKARRLQSDGTYVKVEPRLGEEVINSQAWLIENRGIWNDQSK
jgi:polyphosphate kinase